MTPPQNNCIPCWDDPSFLEAEEKTSYDSHVEKEQEPYDGMMEP